MFCAYHINTSALVQCASCNRGLCSACDHRIKGSPYCQDCIVAGIESLQRGHYHYNTYQNPSQHRSKGKAILAAVCAFFPGAGAIYNRQNFKAIVHFFCFVGLSQLANVPSFGFLKAATILFYFYSILDAFRTARAISEGESAAENEEKFKKALIKRAPAIGVGLIVAGLLVFIRMVQPLSVLFSFTRLAPVALIIFGGYLLTRYFKQSRQTKSEYGDRSSYQLISGTFSNHTSPGVKESRFGR
jgi:TM2 domain-containing membrane protein YozV